MSESYDYRKRADELADVMRRYLIGINTGGIAVALTFSASMAEKGIHPAWIILPLLLFVLGLGISVGSLLYAKHKALKRKEAADEGKEIPKFDAWYQANFTYELITLVVFLVAAGLASYQLQNLDLKRQHKDHERSILNSGPSEPAAADNQSTPESTIALFVKAFQIGDDGMLTEAIAPHAMIPEFNPIQKINCPSPRLTGFRINKFRVVVRKGQYAADSEPGDVEMYVMLLIDEKIKQDKCAISLWEKGAYLLRPVHGRWKIVAITPFWPDEIEKSAGPDGAK